MKIAVCIKHVPDGRLRLDAAGTRIDRSVPSDLNDVDANAIEEALRLVDLHGGEVVVVTMGPDQASDSLRTALALGADRAVHVADDAAAGSDLIGTSKVLAKVLEREAPDVMLFGQQSADGTGGVAWQAVAERLRLPFVSQVTELTITGTSARAIRQTEYGDDVVEAALPLVVSVSDAINEPRYASLKGKMAAKKKPLERIGLADLGIDPAEVGEAGSGTAVLATGEPPTRPNSTRIEDDGTAAQQILDFLVAKELA